MRPEEINGGPSLRLGKLNRVQTGMKCLIILLGLTAALSRLFIFRMILTVILIAFIGRQIFRHPKTLKRTENIILLLFCLLHVIMTVYNYSHYTADNLTELTTMILLFFGLAQNEDSASAAAERRFFLNLAVPVLFLIGIVDIIMYLFYVHGSYSLNGFEEVFGVYEGRLWGLFNANMTALLALVGMLFSFCLWRTTRHRKFHIANIILQLHVMMLAQSRTVWVLFAFMLFTGAVFLYGRQTWKARFRRMPIAILAVVILYFGADLYIGHVTIQPVRMIHRLISEEKFDPEKMKEEEELEGTRAVLSGNITQGRMGLWTSTLPIIRKSPVIGNGFYELRTDSTRYFGEHWGIIVRLFGNHNIYLMILTVGGVLSLGVFLVFAALCGVRYIRYILQEPGRPEMKMVMAFLIIMFVEELVESRILYIFNYSSILFWLLTGYAMLAVREARSRCATTETTG